MATEVPESFVSVRDAFQFSALSVQDLWVRCYSLGGLLTQEQIDDYLNGGGEVIPHELRVIAQALNELFVEQGADHPVPYPPK
jgi:hypothetical protein